MKSNTCPKCGLYYNPIIEGSIPVNRCKCIDEPCDCDGEEYHKRDASCPVKEKREETKIKWEDSKDELYTYFGKCPCGNGSVIQGSKYCSECGKKII